MRDLTLRVTADTGQAEDALKRVERGLGGVESSADKAGKATGGVGLSLGEIGKAAGGYLAIQQSLENLVGFSSGALDAFAEQEQAVKKLTVALQQSGQATPEVIAQYGAMASQFERTTTFSDDLIQQMQALFVQVGKVGPAQMQAALTAATDLATGLDVDLRTATMLVAKAFEGQTSGLKRYGIVVDETDVKTRGVTAVLEAINAQFGGQAQGQLETYAGRVENLGNRWNNFQERAGGMLARVLLPILDLFDRMPESLQTVAFGIGSVTAVLAPLAGGVALVANAFGVSLIPLLTGALSSAWAGVVAVITGTVLPLLQVALPVALKALAALFSVPAGLVVAGILAVVAIWKNWDTIGPIVERVYTQVKTWLVDKFAILVNWIGEKVGAVTGFFKDMYQKVVGGSYVPDMITGIEVQFGRLGSVMVRPTMTATQAVENAFRSMGGVVVGAMQPMFNGMQQAIATRMPSLFGGTGLLSQIMNTGLSSVFGPGGIAATLVMQGMEAIVGLVGKGLKKIGGWFKSLFGGPSAGEMAGRELVEEFENLLAGTLTATQLVETGNEGWKNTVVAIRDKYLSLGLTEADALKDAERLWASSREGAEAAMRVIEEIKRKFAGGIDVPVRVVTEPPPQLPVYGGVSAPTMPPVVADLAGDMVRGSLAGDRSGFGRPLGGIALVSPTASVSGPGAVHIHINGYLENRQSARQLATVVRRELDRDLQQRRRMTRG